MRGSLLAYHWGFTQILPLPWGGGVGVQHTPVWECCPLRAEERRATGWGFVGMAASQHEGGGGEIRSFLHCAISRIFPISRNFVANTFCLSPLCACWCPECLVCRSVAHLRRREVWVRHRNFPAILRHFPQLDLTPPDRSPPPRPLLPSDHGPCRSTAGLSQEDAEAFAELRDILDGLSGRGWGHFFGGARKHERGREAAPGLLGRSAALEVLELPPEATPQDIRTRYRALSLELHPDRNPPDKREECTAKFQAISNAYAALQSEE